MRAAHRALQPMLIKQCATDATAALDPLFSVHVYSVQPVSAALKPELVRKKHAKFCFSHGS